MTIVVPEFAEIVDLAGRGAAHSYQEHPITREEIFEWVKQIRDPEHPTMSLFDLKVVSLEDTFIRDEGNYCSVVFTPTTPECTMGAILGLSIKVLLMQILPLRFTVEVICKEGAHDTWSELNKQLNDKERVLASLANPNIMKVIEASIQPK